MRSDVRDIRKIIEKVNSDFCSLCIEEKNSVISIEGSGTIRYGFSKYNIWWPDIKGKGESFLICYAKVRKGGAKVRKGKINRNLSDGGV